MVEACLRSFPFREELGRPGLLRSADVTSKAKRWSSLPVLCLEVRVFNRLTRTVSPTSAQDWGWRFESADRDGQPYQCTRLGLEV